jgi:hypothetical protein
MQDPLLDAGRRAVRYWNVDGLAELYVGIVWLCAALSIYAAAHLPRSPWRVAVMVVGTLAWMAAILSGKWVISAVKSRVTWPRTGYVAHEKPKAKAYWLLLLIVPLLLMLPFGPRLIVLPVTGLVGAIIAIAVARAMAMGRFYIVAGVFFGLGCALGVAGVEIDTGMSVLYGSAGTLLVISGGLTLWRYLERA